jgi:hypothetical protein
MNSEKRWLERIGLIAALVEKSEGQVLGRTAIMKLIYFLQVLRQLPLAYDFRLHTYGPFDPDVLEDLSYARIYGAVTERTVLQRQGYRFEIKPGRRCMRAQTAAGDWLEGYRKDLDWVLGEFGKFAAPDLELLSTIVFADRAHGKQDKALSLEELAMQVQNIKPRFTRGYVLDQCRRAMSKGFLQAVSAGDGSL